MKNSITSVIKKLTVTECAHILSAVQDALSTDLNVAVLFDHDLTAPLFRAAVEARKSIYGDEVYLRGLIEFTNYCRNDCYYCGIRRSNTAAGRYRLSREDILSCAQTGYGLGFRTFVLQGGEDPYFDDTRMSSIVSDIHTAFPDCAITLSLGERSHDSYVALFEAGADRYLLRHETANAAHYACLHPAGMSHEHRIKCLYDLKSIGYQVGCGFMVGSPGQTLAHLTEELSFLLALQPAMVGIGPFIPHRDTPFGRKPMMQTAN